MSHAKEGKGATRPLTNSNVRELQTPRALFASLDRAEWGEVLHLDRRSRIEVDLHNAERCSHIRSAAAVDDVAARVHGVARPARRSALRRVLAAECAPGARVGARAVRCGDPPLRSGAPVLHDRKHDALLHVECRDRSLLQAESPKVAVRAPRAVDSVVRANCARVRVAQTTAAVGGTGAGEGERGLGASRATIGNNINAP